MIISTNLLIQRSHEKSCLKGRKRETERSTKRKKEKQRTTHVSMTREGRDTCFQWNVVPRTDMSVYNPFYLRSDMCHENESQNPYHSCVGAVPPCLTVLTCRIKSCIMILLTFIPNTSSVHSQRLANLSLAFP